MNISPIQNNAGARRMWILAALFFIAALSVLLFFRGLNDPDEGRYAEVPREMVAGGNWLQMRILGYQYYEKPPLAYWAVAAALKIFGLHDWATRVPLLPVILGICGVAFWMARRYWSLRNASLGGLVVSTMVGIFMGMTILLTDNFLLLWLTLIQWLLFEAFQPQVSRRRQYVILTLTAVVVYLALMTKGLVALVIPGLITFIWLLIERRFLLLWKWPTWLAAAVVAALTMPTLELLERYNPNFLRFFFIEEHFARFQGTRALQGHEEPFWFYGPVLILLTLPWTPFAVRGVRVMFHSRAWKTDALTRYLLIWAGVVVGFFSMSKGKLMPYVLPAIVPLGLLIGRWGVGGALIEGSRTDRRLWWGAAWVLPFVGVGLMGIWLVGYFDFFPEDLAPPSLWTLVSFIPLVILLGALFKAPVLRSLPGFVLILATAYFAFALLLSPIAGKELSSQIEMSSILFKDFARKLSPEDQVVMYREYCPSLSFYTDRIAWHYDVMNEMTYGMKAEPDRPGYLSGRESLRKVMKDHPGRWFVVMEKVDWSRWMKEGIPYKPDLVSDDHILTILEVLPLHQWPAP